MRKVIQHESKTYLAPMPLEEQPDKIDNPFLSDYVYEQIYTEWQKDWIECTGFEIGQEVPEGDWEILPFNQHATPKQQPEREEDLAALIRAAKEINEYLNMCHYENGKPVYLNQVGAKSILHQNLEKALALTTRTKE